MASIYADGIEYLRVRVKATSGGLVYDPTSDDVYFAFLDEDDLESAATWYAGDWETISGQYYGRCLFGVDVTLTAGRYSVLIKIDTGTEVIIKDAGTLIVE